MTRAGLAHVDHCALEMDRILLDKRVARAINRENREKVRPKLRRQAIMRRFPDYQQSAGWTPPQNGRSNTARSRRNQIAKLIARDGDRCYYCGYGFETPAERTRDHVIPVSKGGRSVLSNQVLACKPCNIAKKDEIL